MTYTTPLPATAPNKRGGWRTWALVPGFAGVLATAACGGNTTSDKANPPTSSATASETHSKSVNPVKVTFDSLGSDLARGGSNVINVYPGSGPGDTTPNGTFMKGQPAYGLCKQEGRSVSSRPDQGETPVTSNEWIRLQGGYFATAVYIADRNAVLNELTAC